MYVISIIVHVNVPVYTFASKREVLYIIPIYTQTDFRQYVIVK